MQILLVTSTPPARQATGSMPLLFHAQVSALSVRHDVSVVTVAGPDPAEWDAVDALAASGINVHAVRRPEPYGAARWKRRWRLASSWLCGKYPFRTIWFSEPGVQQILDRLLHERRFDVVAVEDLAMGIYRYRTSAPVVFTEHEVKRPRPIDWGGWSKENPIHWALGEWDWYRWRRHQLDVWRRFETIQVFTERDAATMRTIAPELAGRIRVNPFGIEIPDEVDPGREEKGMILFSGSFPHAPNVDAALWLAREIMPRVRARCREARLTLVGSYPPSSVLALARDDIIVAGQVPEIEPFLERASVVVAPMRIGQGMRTKVLQAMATGKAVVTTPRGAEGLDFAREEPPVLIAEDADGIADSIAVLLASDDMRQALGRRGRAFVAEHFSADAYARRLEAVYAEMQQRCGGMTEQSVSKMTKLNNV